jgi:hypothetical protein
MSMLLVVLFIGLFLALTIGGSCALRDRAEDPGSDHGAVPFYTYQDDAYRYDPGGAEVIDSTAEVRYEP